MGSYEDIYEREGGEDDGIRQDIGAGMMSSYGGVLQLTYSK